MDIKKRECLYSTKHLNLYQTTYVLDDDIERKWDFVSRKTPTGVVTIICRDIKTNSFLFIKQPRVTLNMDVISFPAGLIDKGETPIDAALRELKEETGYDGFDLFLIPAVPTSVGLSNEKTYIILCNVDKTKQGQQRLEDTEQIDVYWYSISDYFKLITSMFYQKEFILSEGSMLFMSGLLYKEGKFNV